MMNMMMTVVRWFLTTLLSVTLLLPVFEPLQATGFLSPANAFKVRSELGSDRQIVLRWSIEKGYKLYRESVKIAVPERGIRLGTPRFPAGSQAVDPTTNETVEIYHDALIVRIPVVDAEGPFTLNVTFQGCAESGICYPPETRSFVVDPGRPGSLAAGVATKETGSALVTPDHKPASADPVPPGTVIADPPGAVDQVAAADSAMAVLPAAQSQEIGTVNQALPRNEGSMVDSTLRKGNLWQIALLFFGFGILLSFTPCILPMLPIVSSIIVGDRHVSRSRIILLSVAYCLGLSVVYTLLGIAAGLAGEGLAGFMQHPAVLTAFAVLLFIMALSMFDLYEFQAPLALQNRLTKMSGGLKGGRVVSVFTMGALSALIMGPCVAAPLAGTLLYISQTKNVVIGGLALFSMAIGTGIPLIIVGVSAGRILPKAGAWMMDIKHIFGLLLIAAAIWIVTPVMPPVPQMLAWGFFAMLCAVFLGLFNFHQGTPLVHLYFNKALSLVLVGVGMIEIAGAFLGGAGMHDPLSSLRTPSGQRYGAEADRTPRFQRVRSSDELDALLASAKKPVMLDFTADWCTSCREMEHLTFSDPEVQHAFRGLTLLQIDVTANSDEERALMKRFNVFGPPAILFFGTDGTHLPAARVDGFLNAREFLGRIRIATGTG